jgi:hypothetical protein
MCELAAQAAGKSVDELLEQVTADPDRAQLFSAAVRAAGNTALDSKLTVLGRLLVDGTLDDHRVDEARLLTATIEDVERLHLRILNHLARNYSESLTDEERSTISVNEHAPHAWTFDKLAEELSVSAPVLEVAIGTLYGDNLVRGHAGGYGFPGVRERQWTLSDPGKVVLELFRAAGEAAAGLPAPEQGERATGGEDGDVE